MDCWSINSKYLSSNDIDFDVYLDTWREIGNTKRELPAHDATGIYRWEGTGTLSSAEVSSLLPGSDSRIHAESITELITKFGFHDLVAAIESPELRRMFESTFGMLYLIEKCDERRAFSQKSYDWVVRIRPDWVLRRDIFHEILDDYADADLVFFDSSIEVETDPHYVSDVCFASKVPHMSFLASAFSLWRDELLKHGLRAHDMASPFHSNLLFGESALAWHLAKWRGGKRIEIATPHAGYILREGSDVTRRKIG